MKVSCSLLMTAVLAATSLFAEVAAERGLSSSGVSDESILVIDDLPDACDISSSGGDGPSWTNLKKEDKKKDDKKKDKDKKDKHKKDKHKKKKEAPKKKDKDSISSARISGRARPSGSSAKGSRVPALLRSNLPTNSSSAWLETTETGVEVGAKPATVLFDQPSIDASIGVASA